jgi:glyoxylase-like metal-dependent hydrolase (beta-lactamase superfamily II)/8-oxo-dGTP pyrophosphatase MutT (NUDIX family)
MATPSGSGRFRDSAAVMLVRGAGESLEVFWVRRAGTLAFQPGFHAFLGGAVDAADAELPLERAGDEPERAARACALRETLEEAGVLPALAAGRADPATLDDARRRLLAGEAGFAELSRRHGWRFDPEALVFAGRWQTPVFAQVRFDTLFFLARMPAGQDARIVPGELAEGEWIRPIVALDRWRRGQVTFAAPILWNLIALAEGEEGLAARLARGPERAATPVRRIELQWGVVLHPMRTRPLPPSQHTNAYLIGESEMALVDPGSDDPAELESLFALIDHLVSEGRRLATIVVTHHHPDHVGGVAAVRERYRVRVAGHPRLAEHLPIDVAIADGEWLPLAPGLGDWRLEARWTPGHTRDSISLWQPRIRAAFVGDLMVGGRGTVIVDPPDGDMRDYLETLDRLAALDARTLYPAHGSPFGGTVHRIRALIEHRLGRERKVIAALPADGAPAAAVEALVPRVYDDTPRDLWSYAGRSLLAHLIKLEAEGRAVRDGDGWRAAAAAGRGAGGRGAGG